ncbi:unnamed protein product [Tenebrio molitor]|nr:unnamed protein product [Tenebrio molitor]
MFKKNQFSFFYNRQKNVRFMHRYQVTNEKIFVKKFPWMLK